MVTIISLWLYSEYIHQNVIWTLSRLSLPIVLISLVLSEIALSSRITIVNSKSGSGNNLNLLRKLIPSGFFFNLPGSCWLDGLFCLQLHCLFSVCSLLKRVSWAGRTGRGSDLPNSLSYELAEMRFLLLGLMHLRGWNC